MHRFPRALNRALSVVSTLMLVASRAAAQALPAASANCAPLAQELAAAQREAAMAEQRLKEIEANAAARVDQTRQCSTSLEIARSQLTHAEQQARECQQASSHQCSAVAAFADELVRGKSPSATKLECIGAEQQRRVAASIAGWHATATAVGQLNSYALGASNSPTAHDGRDGVLDRVMQRLLGAPAGPILPFRRLLVEAMQLLAPAAWEELRAKGTQALDDWFRDSGPLSDSILDEARRVPTAAASNGGPLSVALRLIRAYAVLAQCGSLGSRDACTRARQLEELIETTGPLVTERRVQDIWASVCGEVIPERIQSWLADSATAATREGPSFGHVTEAIYTKLYTCYLDETDYQGSMRVWMESRLPNARALSATELSRVQEIISRAAAAEPEQICARAAHALESFSVPNRCATMPAPEFAAIENWATITRKLPPRVSTSLQICRDYTALLWSGRRAIAGTRFTRPPSGTDLLVTDRDRPETSMSKLRRLCAQRVGPTMGFERAIHELAVIARDLGEPIETPPWRVDQSNLVPVERLRFNEATRIGGWLRRVFNREVNGCAALDLDAERCRQCRSLPRDTAYDCTLTESLDELWAARNLKLVLALFCGALLILMIIWVRRFRQVRRTLIPWARETRRYLEGIGLLVHGDRLRYLVPGRHELLVVDLPREPIWQRWGERAVVVRAPSGSRLLTQHVNRAAELAKRIGAHVSFLTHDDTAAADLGAVRAVLEWSAKGGSAAVLVLPLPDSRLRWSRSAADLLDLVEETSLRGNPFEVRGRVLSSAQFFNRERLVSGLLAAAQAGHWQVITGLRRFGKSSLALEIARRLPGPVAYVDLSGFQHELSHAEDPARVAETILAYICIRLAESARHRLLRGQVPEPPKPEAELDVTALTAWFRDLSRVCVEASGAPPPVLVILDEIEQALALDRDQLRIALQVVAIVIGRLKGSLGDASLPEGGAPVAVFLCSAFHPLLWAPLAPLANQSIMGSFPSVCVPCLPNEAAKVMLRSLGARQGIRFSEDALARITEASQGVPLLARRICASILELYDPERARQGSLGAVDVGIEGSREAIERENRVGSPLRVWISAEICEVNSIPGVMLRALAREPTVNVTRLFAIAHEHIRREFARTGIERAFSQEELERRTAEAADLAVRLLGETGLVRSVGDLTAPSGYELPDGSIRRILKLETRVNGSPNVHPAPL